MTGAPSRERPDHATVPLSKPQPKASGHRWMMVACCIPMLVIAVVLVATGVAGGSAIFFAVMCTAMMAMMMGSMGHGGDQHRHV
jgi:hypothetical protein